MHELKRSDIKRRPLADATLAGLEPETKAFREEAAELRKIVSSGADPLEQKRSAKAVIDAARIRTFRASAEAWLKAKEEKGLATSTLNKIRTYLDKDILPALDDKPLDQITRID